MSEHEVNQQVFSEQEGIRRAKLQEMMDEGKSLYFLI